LPLGGKRGKQGPPTPAMKNIQKCGLHAFRHGRVSFLVENNVPLPVIFLSFACGQATVRIKWSPDIPMRGHNSMRISSLVCLQSQTCKRRQHKKRVLNCLQSICGERSSAGRASVCGSTYLSSASLFSRGWPHLSRPNLGYLGTVGHYCAKECAKETNGPDFSRSSAFLLNPGVRRDGLLADGPARL
jgi:hypothetical protein